MPRQLLWRSELLLLVESEPDAFPDSASHIAYAVSYAGSLGDSDSSAVDTADITDGDSERRADIANSITERAAYVCGSEHSAHVAHDVSERATDVAHCVAFAFSYATSVFVCGLV